MNGTKPVLSISAYCDEGGHLVRQIRLYIMSISKINSYESGELFIKRNMNKLVDTIMNERGSKQDKKSGPWKVPESAYEIPPAEIVERMCDGE
jgi:hypothetical protein